MYCQGMEKKRRMRDIAEIAFETLQEITGQTPKEESPPDPTDTPTSGKNPAAVALGRLGGLKGGKARAEKLSPKKRKEIARKAAISRWNKPDKQ